MVWLWKLMAVVCFFTQPAVDGKKDISEEQLRLATWSALASHVTPSIQRVVEFAKRVPGFVDLSQDDQLILIKIGFFEVWLGHVSRSVHTGEGTLVLADGTTFSRQQLELIFDVCCTFCHVYNILLIIMFAVYVCAGGFYQDVIQIR